MLSLKKSNFLGWLFLLIIISGFISCTPQEKPQPLPPRISETLKTIVVIPFDYYCPTETPLPFDCPVKGIIPGTIEPEAKEIMNQLLRRELPKLVNKYNFIFLKQTDFETLLEEALNTSKNPQEVIRFIANKTGAQGILYGKIFRFKERKGLSWSVEEPASVAFTLVLYYGETGTILWQMEFDETQKPLSENMLNLSLYGKIKWLKAEELAERGLQKILKSFP
jgi:hypothetical protein